jgi:hypothetical protein
MALYILSYTKNMEFRNNLVEFHKIRETIEMLKKYDVDVSYVTKVKEDDTDVKKLLGIYKRTKKLALKWKYGNDIERASIILGSRPIPVDEFMKGVMT